MADRKKTDASAKPERPARHPWRENIEALVMAIAVALLFKVFILEISKIPSGSMQPTLMGNPRTEIFDRVLVDKLSFGYRDPERFEIVVFKHPLERSRIMVKRLVGMPGESLKIEHGDLWTRTAEAPDWTHLRRPAAVQEAMWRRLDRQDRKRSAWAQMGTTSWKMEAGSIVAGGPGRARYRPDSNAIVDEYTDGYHDSVRSEIGNGHFQSGVHPVGDLRLEGSVGAHAETTGVTFTLTEGRMNYEFHLPGPVGDEDTPSVRWSDSTPNGAEPRSASAASPWRLPARGTVSFAVENLDDRLTLEIDGDPVVTLEVDAQARQDSTLSLEVLGGGARFEDLVTYRDIYYFHAPDPNDPSRSPDELWSVDIPDGHYVMLGDNTQDSADSRAWEAVSITWSEGEQKRTESGNFRPGMVQGNPVVASFGDEEGWAFRDLWGELHWFAQRDILAGPIPGAYYPGTPGPFVPRSLILGRAMAVFWPLKIGRGMWRLGWLH